jgi:hypothetical protein
MSQMGSKLFLEGQLQMVVVFAEVLKPKDLLKPNNCIGGNIS